MMARGPIYIGGLGRSGKTWMRFLLTSHPHIAMSRRTNMWTRYFNRYGDLGRAENFERCLEALLRSKHVQLMHPDPARIRRTFRQGEPSYARLFALLHEHYAEAQGKPRWGDQTELLERCADPVLAADPDAKMIHMVRDPRDRYEASLARSPKGKGRVGGATAQWLHSVRLAERNRRRYPDRYLVVRYESLVTEPEATLAAVCDFLGETYFPEMLLLKDTPRFEALHAEGRSPISAGYIGGYRGVTPEREIAFMQLFAGREMAAQGYAPAPVRISPVAWLAFACVGLPVNIARAVAWRSLAARQYGAP